MVLAGDYRVTTTALRTARRDFKFVEDCQVAAHVLRLTQFDFYKSMTSNYDSAVWQDVYYGVVDGEVAYIKLQVLDDVGVVISFKRSEEA